MIINDKDRDVLAKIRYAGHKQDNVKTYVRLEMILLADKRTVLYRLEGIQTRDGLWQTLTKKRPPNNVKAEVGMLFSDDFLDAHTIHSAVTPVIEFYYRYKNAEKNDRFKIDKKLKPEVKEFLDIKLFPHLLDKGD